LRQANPSANERGFGAYGSGRWRKLKGNGRIRLLELDTIVEAELHWYEAHSIGRREMKIKRFLSKP
jgi:hypothetical protein